MADGMDPVVRAARAGDNEALDRLVAQHLPLVYNIVGRALERFTDVDDVVQDVMLQAVRDLPALRKTEAFRSWLVAITVREIRRHERNRRAAPDVREPVDVADPTADFVEVTILSLQLEGQRREVVEATRWLDDDDRELLSLWWLETAGRLHRTEVAQALGTSTAQTAVRIQRMKTRLETARTIVQALAGNCRDLDGTAHGWDGRPAALWRKRFARHVRDCPACLPGQADAVPADRLLSELALVPIPLALAGATALAPATTKIATVKTLAAKHSATGLLTGKAVTLPAAAILLTSTAAFAYGQRPQPAAPEPVRPIAAATPAKTTPAPPPAEPVAKKAPAAPPSTRFPIRAAFYYPWYDGGRTGFGKSNYKPSAGYYDMDKPATIDRQIKDMRYAGLQAGIASWWGRGKREDKRLPLLLNRAARLGFSWTIYYEPEGYGNPSAQRIRSDLRYLKRYTAKKPWLRVKGKPVIFVWADGTDACGMATRWKKANQGIGFHVVLKVFGGYLGCAAQPAGWHQYASGYDRQRGHSAIASPGFWKYDEKPLVPRDPAVFRKQVTAVARSKEPWQLIISYNEWGEGTAFESATAWPSSTGHGRYSDILHQVFSAHPR